MDVMPIFFDRMKIFYKVCLNVCFEVKTVSDKAG